MSDIMLAVGDGALGSAEVSHGTDPRPPDSVSPGTAPRRQRTVARPCDGSLNVDSNASRVREVERNVSEVQFYLIGLLVRRNKAQARSAQSPLYPRIRTIGRRPTWAAQCQLPTFGEPPLTTAVEPLAIIEPG